MNRWRDLSFDFTVTLIYRVSRNYLGFLLNLRNKIRFCLKNVPCYFFFLLPCPHVLAPPRFNRNIVPFTPSVSRSSLALVAWNQRQLHVRKHRHLLWSTWITLICIDPEWRMNSINTTKGISLWVLLKIRGWMSWQRPKVLKTNFTQNTSSGNESNGINKNLKKPKIISC